MPINAVGDYLDNCPVGNTWITDVTHFPGSVIGEPIPANVHPAAYRMGQFMGSIVAAGTSVRDGRPRTSGLRCRRRPGRRACPGHLIVERLDIPEHILWHCSHCDDNGLISGWRDSVYDLRSSGNPGTAAGPLAIVNLDDDGYALLRSALTNMDQDTERAVMAAEHTNRGIRVEVPEDLLDDLVGGIAFEANHESNRARQRRLDELADVFDRAEVGERS